ncbi:MAG TPA: HIT family protein [Candidatus Obscuribacterales bacterium]
MCADLAGESCPVVYKDSCWIVRHSRETNILGYLVLASRRHFLDLSESTDEEAESYGKILSTAIKAVRQVVPCERVYTFTLGELVPHFHVHIIPRTAGMPRAYRGRGIFSYPALPAADSQLVEQVSARLRLSIRRMGLPVR